MNICFPHPPGSGGPASFQIRFEKELKKRDYKICYARDFVEPDLIFVVGGTKRLFWLFKMKLKGIPILYRLDGINWLHKKKNPGLKKFLVAEIRNWSNKCIHAFLADKIIYQSRFVEAWWNRSGWRVRKNTAIIYNGVDLPDKEREQDSSTEKRRLVILEGTIDYSPYAVELINELADSLSEEISIELYGKFEIPGNEHKIDKRVQYKGFLDLEKVFDVLHGSVYLSLDVNPACPNTIIEAMTCGAPIVAFDTGALPELVINGSGEIVAYGSDPWKLDYPNTKGLMDRIEKIIDHYQTYSANALKLAEEKFGFKKMVDSYISEIQRLK